MSASASVVVDTAFMDVHADGLRWALGLPRRTDALAGAVVHLPHSVDVELLILGASHQVLVRRNEQLLLSETVACDLDADTAMPATARADGYEFTSTVHRLEASDFAHAVEDVIADVSAHEHGLLARFPGDPLAVTAVLLSHGPTLSWTTWHAYPNTGELVHTRTELALTPDKGNDL